MEEKTSSKAADTAVPAEEFEDGSVATQTSASQLSQQLLILCGLALATLAMALDGTIIVTAIPKITTDFQSLNDIGWYGSAYYLTLVTTQPCFSKLYKQYGKKEVFLASLLIFEIGSIVCATSKQSYIFIIGRAIAGSGGAGILSGSMIIAGTIASAHRRPTFIGALSGIYGVGCVAAPLLGGAFTQSTRLTWRFCFWINLPIGFITCLILLTMMRVREKRNEETSFSSQIVRMDLPGALLFICSLVCLLLALQWGGVQFAWRDSRVWGCLLGSALIFIAFIALEASYCDPTIRLVSFDTVRQRTVLVSCLFAVCFTMAVRTHLYYLPLYFQVVRGDSPLGSGIATLPYLGTMIIGPFVSGPLIQRFRIYNPFILAGSILLTIGSILIFMLKPTTPVGVWVVAQLLGGLGTGLCMQIPFTAVQNALPADELASGVSLVAFSNGLGPAIAVSVAQNIFINKLADNLSQLGVDPQPIIAGGATQLEQLLSGQSADLLTQVLEVYNRAISSAFVLAIVASGLGVLLALCLEWRRLPGKK